MLRLPRIPIGQEQGNSGLAKGHAVGGTGIVTEQREVLNLEVFWNCRLF